MIWHFKFLSFFDFLSLSLNFASCTKALCLTEHLFKDRLRGNPSASEENKKKMPIIKYRIIVVIIFTNQLCYQDYILYIINFKCICLSIQNFSSFLISSDLIKNVGIKQNLRRIMIIIYWSVAEVLLNIVAPLGIVSRNEPFFNLLTKMVP